MIVSDSIYLVLFFDVFFFIIFVFVFIVVLVFIFILRKRKLICITEVFMEISIIFIEIELFIINKVVFKNEVVGFGGKSFLCLYYVYVCVYLCVIDNV